MSRKRIALACTAVVVGVGSVVIPVAANAGEEGNGVTAACRVADGATVWWASGEVSLANKGDRPVRNWTAEFEVSQGQVTLDNPWAYELRQSGRHVTVKPIADRADVAARGSRAVKVGINPAGKGIPKITGCRVKGPSDSGGDTGTSTAAPADSGSFVKDHTAVHLMWKPPAGGAEVVRYEVFQDGKQVKTVKDTMTDIERLAPATRYAFKVRAVRADGRTTGFSKDIVLTTLAAPGQDKAKPVIPADLEATASGPYQASLRWRAATDDVAVTGYRIYRNGTKVQEADAKATSATVSGLTASTAHRFKVTAVDASGKESDPTRETQVTAAAPDGNGGAAPGDFAATTATKQDGGVTQHYLNLTWSVPQGVGQITTYQVHLNGKPAQTFMWGTGDPVLPVPTTKGSREVLVGAHPGATYTVKIRARLGDGTWGAFSRELTVKTAG
ncbi:fibronectin type III domain-containing protein [Streptomyces sp. NRRL F-2664]|uniref:fibronectin type III domain-containing protein n=1 Tax=Streptomyces sp. NRRL F-2664 TaxID=1463842 RepID=UPI0006922370|nr:fibronectin type III domain-containing protein [Streptomyces sp. NRRL F-2664]